MKVLITGAAGFLGRGLVVPFEGQHELRLMDVVDFETPHEKIVGDVADLQTVRRAVEGVDAIVIAHMASRQSGSYEEPTLPFDANVKGTANLFFAGVERGVKRYALVSGEVVIWAHPTPPRRRRDLPYRSTTMYGLTKVCQEVIAEQFQREFDLHVAALRVGYILSADDPNHVVDKYGKHIRERNAVNTDRRDIGLAALRALELPDLKYEIFYILGAPEAAGMYEMEPSYTRLGWRPQYDFSWQKRPRWAFPAPLPEATAGEYSIAVATDRTDGLYRLGQEITFTVTVLQDGRPVTSGEARCEVFGDGGNYVAGDTSTLTGQPLVFKATLDKPVILRAKATIHTVGGKVHEAWTGAAVEPLRIKPSLPAPDDFDAFWARQKEKLAAVKMTAQVTPVTSPLPGLETFDVQVTCLGDKPVSAYLARPAGAEPRSLPALLCTHSAGVFGADLARAAEGACEGFLTLDLNAHGVPNGRSAAWYDDLFKREIEGFSRRGIESPETYYFLGMYLRLVRAIDFLVVQPEWNGRVLVAAGVSQGGGQALVAAGLDPRVTILSACVPTFCDRTAALVGRAPGWPGALPTGRDKKPDPVAVATVRYFDAVNFAARAKAEAIFAVGFLDGLCPAGGVYAAYNAYAGPKELLACPNCDHALTPAIVQHTHDWYVARARATAGK